MLVLHLRLMEGWFASPFASFSRKFWKKLKFRKPHVLYHLHVEAESFLDDSLFTSMFLRRRQMERCINLPKMSSGGLSLPTLPLFTAFPRGIFGAQSGVSKQWPSLKINFWIFVCNLGPGIIIAFWRWILFQGHMKSSKEPHRGILKVPKSSQKVFLKTHTRRNFYFYLESLNMVSKTLEV